jgi:hypothetical protein
VVTHREVFSFKRPWRWLAEPLFRSWLETDTTEEMVRFKQLIERDADAPASRAVDAPPTAGRWRVPVERPPLTLSVHCSSPATMAVRHFCHTPRAASTELHGTPSESGHPARLLPATDPVLLPRSAPSAPAKDLVVAADGRMLTTWRPIGGQLSAVADK